MKLANKYDRYIKNKKRQSHYFLSLEKTYFNSPLVLSSILLFIEVPT